MRYSDIDTIDRLWRRKGVFSKLEERYRKRIMKRFDWDRIEAELGEEGSVFVGSVSSIFPSGKFYTSWTTNQGAKDVLRDETFGRVLDEILESKNIQWRSSEGDPCGVVFHRVQ